MYEKIGWEDSPSTKTPILAVSLNQMDNGIERANNGIVFSYSATFTADGVVKKTSSLTSLGAGDFATSQTDIVTAFIASSVTSIGSGTFANCTSLKTIYIDNTVNNISIASGAIPDNTTVVYCNDDNFINVNELLANAIKSLKTKIVADEEQHKADVQTLNTNISQVADNLQTVKETAQREIAITNINVDGKESLSNKVSVITHPSLDYYPDTKAVFDYVNSKLETPLADIEQNKADIAKLKVDKVDNTDFSTYKSTNDTAVKKNATDIAQLNADVFQNAIKVTTDKSTSAVINDSSDKNILDLICDEKDNSKQIAFYRKNLFDFNSIRVYGNDSVSNIVVNKDTKSISFTTSETDANSGVYIRHNDYLDFKGYGVDYTKLGGKHVALSFDIQSDINCRIAVQFTKYSYSYFDITPTRQRIVVTDTVDINKINKALCFYTNKTKANITISNIQIEVNNIATDYEDCDCQKVTLANANVELLHTYYPNTTVICDSDFQLTYIADTKLYIDNKFDELATAIVAHESEVI